MPGNVRTIVQRHMKTEEQINDEYQEAEIERLSLPHVRQLNRRMQDLCRVMWSIYDNYYAEHPNTHSVPALSFDYHFTQVMPSKPSTRTIVKLKKLLGIHSVRRDGVWYWSTPLYDMNGILREYHNQQTEVIRTRKSPLARKLLALRRPAVKRFLRVMEELHYDAPREAVYTMMGQFGYSRNTILHCKSLMGVASIKVMSTGSWHWVYPSQEVLDWLIDELYKDDDYTREQSDIYELAASKGWSERVVDQTIVFSDGKIMPYRTSWRLRA